MQTTYLVLKKLYFIGKFCRETRLIKAKVLPMMITCVILAAGCGDENTVERLAIHKGSFKASVTETGELEAINAYTIITPDLRRYGRLIIVEIVDHGHEVKKGDLVVRLDPSNVMNYITEQETRLDVEMASLNKMLAQHDGRMNSLQAELKSTQANFDMKKLEVEKFQFESEKKKKVKELEFEQAKIRLDNIKKRIDLETNIAGNELKIQKIKVQQRVENIQKGYEAKEQLDLYSEINGIVQIRNHWRTDQILKQGDEVWRGMPLVSIPDISEMKVKSTINETDISKIKKGQKVIVRLDAYPDKPFNGEISDIGLLSYPKQGKSNVKVFDVEVNILDSDPALKPGMTVSCEFIYADMEETFFVPNECIEKNHDGYYLYKETLTGYEQQKVNVGARNTTHTIIVGNFNEGTKLIPVSEIKENTEENKI